jgi:hypothetical protein
VISVTKRGISEIRVLKALNIKIIGFSDMAACSLLKQTNVSEVHTASIIRALSSWRCSLYAPLKRRFASILHGALFKRQPSFLNFLTTVVYRQRLMKESAQ